MRKKLTPLPMRSFIIPAFGGEFKTSKRIFENLGNFRGKLTNSRILEQFELSPDPLTTFHRQKRFCLYSNLPREGSVCSYPTYTSV